MDVVYKIRKMFYRLHDFDCVAGSTGGPEVLQVKQRVISCSSTKAWHCVKLTCELAGLAAVRHGGQVTVIGNEISLRAWEWPLSPLDAAIAEAQDFLDHPEELRPRVAAYRAERLQRQTVERTVASNFPDLRVWPDEPDYTAPSPSHVQLREKSCELELFIKM